MSNQPTYSLVPARSILERRAAVAHREFTDTLRMHRSYQREVILKTRFGTPLGRLPQYIAAARRRLNTTSRRYHSYRAALDLLEES